MKFDLSKLFSGEGKETPRITFQAAPKVKGLKPQVYTAEKFESLDNFWNEDGRTPGKALV